LSDKLLKSGAVSGRACCCEVAYITLLSFEVNRFFFSDFIRRLSFPNLLNTAFRKPLCRVSGGAL